jgi:hypothetical protein
VNLLRTGGPGWRAGNEQKHCSDLRVHPGSEFLSHPPRP